MVINYMIRLEIGLEFRHGGVMRVCATEDKIAVVVVVSFAVFQKIPFVSRPCLEVTFYRVLQCCYYSPFTKLTDKFLFTAL